MQKLYNVALICCSLNENFNYLVVASSVKAAENVVKNKCMQNIYNVKSGTVISAYNVQSGPHARAISALQLAQMELTEQCMHTLNDNGWLLYDCGS